MAGESGSSIFLSNRLRRLQDRIRFGMRVGSPERYGQ
jgi:hypothetical protein